MKKFFGKIGRFCKRAGIAVGRFFAAAAGLFGASPEEKEIARQNRTEMRRFEKAKKQKRNPEDYMTGMKNAGNIAEIDNLRTYFYTDAGILKAVDGVSIDIPKGKTVGVVGESGCGKSITAMSVMRLIPGPQGQITGGEIRFASAGDKVYNLVNTPLREMYKIRGAEIAMIFQEPMTSLNPIMTLGGQLDEVTLLHTEGATKESARARSIEILRQVGIPMPDTMVKRYPHELSGGMRQRVMIAMALLCNPRLIIADEPTTALDVTIQAQILDLLQHIKDKFDGSILLITHDLGVIAEMADFVYVMYAGRVVEAGTAEEIFSRPLHPYTVGLQKSKPDVEGEEAARLYSIPGTVPAATLLPPHCYFYDRCDRRTDACLGEYPELKQVSQTHSVSCHNYGGRHDK
jgi:peptide/nickel transport system ATP-binding protein